MKPRYHKLAALLLAQIALGCSSDDTSATKSERIFVDTRNSSDAGSRNYAAVKVLEAYTSPVECLTEALEANDESKCSFAMFVRIDASNDSQTFFPNRSACEEDGGYTCKTVRDSGAFRQGLQESLGKPFIRVAVENEQLDTLKDCEDFISTSNDGLTCLLKPYQAGGSFEFKAWSETVVDDTQEVISFSNSFKRQNISDEFSDFAFTSFMECFEAIDDSIRGQAMSSRNINIDPDTGSIVTSTRGTSSEFIPVCDIRSEGK